MPIADSPVLLSAEDVAKYYPLPGGLFGATRRTVRAVDGVSFSIRQGETFGLVGESGCGKSTLCRAVARLESGVGGRIIFKGQEILTLPPSEMRPLRRDIQMVFQDPKASLHPLQRVREALAEPFRIHGVAHGKALQQQVTDLLRRVGLRAEHGDRLPKQLSGGQRQLVCIARAIALRPKLVIFDEPVSSLDASVQSQILNLLQDLQQDLGLACLFVSHNLNVVDYLCDTIAVMYLGKIVEIAPKAELAQNPLHPYTQALLASVLKVEHKGRKTGPGISGEMPSAANPPPGCRFHTRCLFAFDRCRVEEPALQDKGQGHLVSCHLY